MLGTARAYIFGRGMLCGVAQTEPRLGEPERNVEACLARLEEAGPAGGGVLVGPAGLVGRYRKTHLPFLGVDRFVAPGEEPPEVYDTPVGRLGIVICYELRFPEPTRALALVGAELVLHPTNWPNAVKPFADFLTRARAAENRVFLLTANRVGAEGGVEFFGRSQIVDPLGDRLVEAGDGEDELILAEIDPAEAREKDQAIVPGEYEVHLFGDRRPELYGALVEETRPVHVP